MFAVNKLRTATSIFKRNVGVVRNAGGAWSYREPPAPPSRAIMYTAEAIGATLWWWLLVHFWYQPEHVFGHFPYPDPKEWTNEELGIPPDDAE